MTAVVKDSWFIPAVTNDQGYALRAIDDFRPVVVRRSSIHSYLWRYHEP